MLVLESVLGLSRRVLPAFTLLFISTHLFAANTGSISLAWDRSIDTNVTGYKVYWGISSGNYISQQDNLNKIKATISDLTVGVRYYFAVTAYNQSGLESTFSDEVSALVGGDPTPTPSPTSTPRSTPPPTPSPSPSVSPTATPQGTPLPSATPVASPPAQYLANLSTRGEVANADAVLIGGFIISGDAEKKIAIRALGPSLASFGLMHPLADPLLQLFNASGNVIDENDNWTSLAPDSVPANLQPSDPSESVIVRSLAPGAYTAVLRSADGSAGTTLVEVYDLDPGSSRVSNMSTRGDVGSDDSVLIAGVMAGGATPSQLLLRGIGPSLTAYGVMGTLSDPVLELHNSDGSLIYENDNWRSTQEQDIINTSVAPTDDRESAILATLPPGAYTAIVRGANNSTGVALVEVYTIEN